MATFHTTTSEPNALQQLFSVGDAATYLGVSASTVRRRIAAGAVRAHRWGRTWMLWRDDLDWYWYCAWLANTDSATRGVRSADVAAAEAEPLSGHRAHPDVA